MRNVRCGNAFQLRRVTSHQLVVCRLALDEQLVILAVGRRWLLHRQHRRQTV